MPTLQFKISPSRARKFSIIGGDNKIKLRRRVEYDVELSWDDGSTDFSTVSEPEVLAAAGLPKVNYSVYAFNGKIIPYLQCSGKSATQIPKRLRRWRVSADFDSKPREGSEEDQEPVDPAAPETFAPKVETSSETIEIVADKDIHDKPIVSPSKTLYTTPIMRPVSLTVLTITQYELGWTDDKIALRNRAVNDAIYRGKDP